MCKMFRWELKGAKNGSYKQIRGKKGISKTEIFKNGLIPSSFCLFSSFSHKIQFKI